MVKVQKLIALILSMAMLLTIFSSCSGAPTAEWALKIDGTEISPGLYLAFQQQAYQNALEEIKKEESALIKEAALNGQDVEALQAEFDKQDFLKKTVNGQSSADWTAEETLRISNRYVATLRLSDEEGLALTSEDESSIQSQITSYYEPSADGYYRHMGIGKSSYRATVEDYLLQEKLFHHWYDEDGTDPVPSDQIDAYFVEHYAKGAVYTVYGSSLEESQLETRKAQLQAAADSLNSGESFGNSIKTYEDTVALETASESSEESTETENTPEDENPIQEESDVESNSVEEEETETLPDIASYTQIFNIENNSTYLPADVINAISTDLTFGNYQVIESNSNLYLVARLELIPEEDIANYKEAVLHELMEDPFNERLESAAIDYPVEKDSAVLNYYTVKRFWNRYKSWTGA